MLLRQAALLVVDDASSALDGATEQLFGTACSRSSQQARSHAWSSHIAGQCSSVLIILWS